jgi:hypothetical protein
VPLGGLGTAGLARDLATGQLPAFSFVIPDKAHDYNTEDGTSTVKASDQELGLLMLSILASPEYLSGQTAVFITFDEGNGAEVGEDCATTLSEDCHIPTVVISPSIRPGTRSDTYFDAYSLLLTTEQLLGLPCLAGQYGITSSSMVPSFGL